MEKLERLKTLLLDGDEVGTFRLEIPAQARRGERLTMTEEEIKAEQKAFEEWAKTLVPSQSNADISRIGFRAGRQSIGKVVIDDTLRVHTDHGRRIAELESLVKAMNEHIGRLDSRTIGLVSR